MDKNEMVSKIRLYKDFKLMLEETKKEIEAIEDAFKAEMTKLNLEEFTVDIFKIRWTPVSTTKVDAKLLREELPDVAARYSNTTESRRFSIS